MLYKVHAPTIDWKTMSTHHNSVPTRSKDERVAASLVAGDVTSREQWQTEGTRPHDPLFIFSNRKVYDLQFPVLQDDVVSILTECSICVYFYTAPCHGHGHSPLADHHMAPKLLPSPNHHA